MFLENRYVPPLLYPCTNANSASRKVGDIESWRQSVTFRIVVNVNVYGGATYIKFLFGKSKNIGSQILNLVYDSYDGVT